MLTKGKRKSRKGKTERERGRETGDGGKRHDGEDCDGTCFRWRRRLRLQWRSSIEGRDWIVQGESGDDYRSGRGDPSALGLSTADILQTQRFRPSFLCRPPSWRVRTPPLHFPDSFIHGILSNNLQTLSSLYTYLSKATIFVFYSKHNWVTWPFVFRVCRGLLGQ